MDGKRRRYVQAPVMKLTRVLPGAVLSVLLAIVLSGCGTTGAVSTVAAPTFSPAGGAYNSAQTVTLSSTTPGAVFYYTCYGPGLGAPCVDTNNTSTLPPAQTGAFLGTPYTGPITVSGTETISAIATYSNAPFSAPVTASYTLPLPAPTFSVAGGAYTSFQSVALADAVPDATIYYTTNGTTPTTTSSVYTAGKPITVSASETINAIAVDATYANSGVSTAAYSINLATAATPTISPASGTYTSIQTVTIADATPGVAIMYSLNGGVPVAYSAPIQISASSTISATASLYGNYLTSPAATATYTINLPPAPTPTFTPAAGTYTSIQSVAIADSVAGASIYYTTNGTAPTTASTLYTGPITVSATQTISAIAIGISLGYSQSAVGTAAYTINLPPAATPTFTPAAGTYTSVQTVNIADATAGVAIYYTTNGTTPTTSSALYNAATGIPVISSETIQAIAINIAGGYSQSAVASAAYTLNLPATTTPTFSPAAGTYAGPQTVTIADTASGAVIYYTLDGTTPTVSSTQYTVPITVSESETIKAIALAPKFGPSAVASAAYTIQYSLSGTVLTGTQAVSGASVTVYAAGTGGYGLGSSAVSAAATTNASGGFTVLYNCPTPTSQIYLVSSGGNPGLAAGTNNPSMAMMTALGACTTLTTASPAPTVTVNEVTTVASVWALQQFMASPTVNTTQGVPMIGTSAKTYNGVQTGVIGLQNAFAMVNNMVNISTGSAAKPSNAWATSESAKINSVADILYSCDSTNPTTSTGCSTLLADATPATQTLAVDGIQAAWYVAQNPGNNVANLYKLYSAQTTPPFTGLTATPNDFTIAVNLAPQYTNGTTATYAVNTPHYVAIDGYGNVWLDNIHGTSGIASSLAAAAPASVVELAPNGSVLMNPVTSFTASTTSGTYSQFVTKPSTTVAISSVGRMLAIDTNNNVWMANYNASAGTPAAGSVAYFTGSSGVGKPGAVGGGYFVGNAPWGIAIDGHNDVYVSNTGNTGMDPLSVGKFTAGTGAYTYSTSSSAAAPNALPNVKAVTGGSGSFNYYGSGSWTAVMAIDTNTAVTGGADGILWTASPSCVTTSPLYDSAANIAWGVVDMFNADTLSPLADAEATTSYSGATPGPGSATNCGSTTTGASGDVALAGTGLQIGQVFTAAMASPYGVAIDKNNGVWIADASYSSNSPGFNGLTYLAAPSNSSSGLIPSSAYIVNGTLTPTGSPSQGSVQRESTYDEVDGNNNVWVASQGIAAIAEASYNPTTNTITYLTPATNLGFTHTQSSTYGIAIDPSGNVWLTNTGATATYTGQAGSLIPIGASMTVVVGAAGPVVTPLSERVASNTLGQKP
jgi:hypothetical protein